MIRAGSHNILKGWITMIKVAEEIPRVMPAVVSWRLRLNKIYAVAICLDPHLPLARGRHLDGPVGFSMLLLLCGTGCEAEETVLFLVVMAASPPRPIQHAVSAAGPLLDLKTNVM
jgi:hypothetical protein